MKILVAACYNVLTSWLGDDTNLVLMVGFVFLISSDKTTDKPKTMVITIFQIFSFTFIHHI